MKKFFRLLMQVGRKAEPKILTPRVQRKTRGHSDTAICSQSAEFSVIGVLVFLPAYAADVEADF